MTKAGANSNNGFSRSLNVVWLHAWAANARAALPALVSISVGLSLVLIPPLQGFRFLNKILINFYKSVSFVRNSFEFENFNPSIILLRRSCDVLSGEYEELI